MGRPVTVEKRRVICELCGLVRWVYPRRGRALPKRCQRCNYAHRRGPDNGRWRGGITTANKKLRASPEYQAWRTAVFERDQYTCIGCGQHGGRLHADHIKPFAEYPELRLDVSNGRTLCEECHAKTPTYLSRALKGKPGRADHRQARLPLYGAERSRDERGRFAYGKLA